MLNSESPNVYSVIDSPPYPSSDASPKPWTLCLIPTGQIECSLSGWHQLRSAPGIYLAQKCIGDKFYEVAVNPSYVPLLQFYEFECDFNYDPVEPVDADIRIHGKSHAKKRAETRFLRNAVKAIRSGLGRGLELCYCDIARSHGLQAPLEQAILAEDISESYANTRPF
ncbi:hypothetical protein M501DRAFT_1016564 [Patellaria atrata CBS 101060]|uniref:Uncharacterized protein n=1 Tax=Patellaria atrata CBS 101060 TaxID=1346257 RepID=A0A9P4S9B4_9PEZI|nr:hypothetical protein M501DRAFT_1016564 [Patellaria atrata CBS 101060]